ncbi:MAG: pantoate--beta-alanine ligase [Pirellulales bacterium]
MTRKPPTVAARLVYTADALRERLADARQSGQSVGLVPTMGALHEGHLSLVDASRRDGGLTVVTIFVNPAQFGPGEDYKRYPRALSADFELLAGRGAELVFAPETSAMYGAEHATYVEVGGPALPLEGEFRPGHFRGVATVVLKLFALAQPDRAYFGRKDFQQSLVVRRMVADLNLPLEIVVCPIVREPDGLALSSRNAYLSAHERARALAISRSLERARQSVDSGQRDARAIIAEMHDMLRAAELQVDYVAICDPDTLVPIEHVDRPAVALVAARVGANRLIDNELLG